MKKSVKRVIELREKDIGESKITKWEVMVPCGLEEFRIIEVVADGYFLGSDDLMQFWTGKSYIDGVVVAIFSDWIYAIKKPSV